MSSENQMIGERTGRVPENLVLSPATRDQQPILANLLELYIYDFSELLHLQLNESGRFGYPDLPLYWSEPGRHPILVSIDGLPAGFALVRKGSRISGNTDVWDMAEFFVVRGHRRRGVGKQAAGTVWRQFPGEWEIRVIEANLSAVHFWAEAIKLFTGRAIAPSRFDKNGVVWLLFRFDAQQQKS
jgi:predicted acetyltransferase